jgi:endo-1,4-beta-mannosidase
MTFVASVSTPTVAAVQSTPSFLSGLKLMNYYPAQHGWGRMWQESTPAEIQADFHRIAGMGVNAVRLIVPTDVFGYPDPAPVMLKRLARAVALASTEGMKVQMTLFDSFSAYRDLAGSQRWARAVLTPFRGDARVAFVEVRNELDPADARAMAWARSMIPYVRSISSRPVAASSRVPGPGDVVAFAALVRALSASRPDVFSYHFYGDPTLALDRIGRAVALASPTPLFVGEAGVATAQTSTAAVDPVAELGQVWFFKLVEWATYSLGLPPAAPWIFSDFAPGSLAPGTPGGEYRMGLLRADGTAKPAFEALSAFFTYKIPTVGAVSGSFG